MLKRDKQTDIRKDREREKAIRRKIEEWGDRITREGKKGVGTERVNKTGVLNSFNFYFSA